MKNLLKSWGTAFSLLLIILIGYIGSIEVGHRPGPHS